jgi:hypothetical protein
LDSSIMSADTPLSPHSASTSSSTVYFALIEREISVSRISPSSRNHDTPLDMSSIRIPEDLIFWYEAV